VYKAQIQILNVLIFQIPYAIYSENSAQTKRMVKYVAMSGGFGTKVVYLV